MKVRFFSTNNLWRKNKDLFVITKTREDGKKTVSKKYTNETEYEFVLPYINQ